MFKYFDINFIIKKDEPKFKIQLKEKFKKGKLPLLKPKGQPISGSLKEYYWNYLGKDLGQKVFEERQKLFGKKKTFLFFKKHNLLTQEQIKFVEQYFKDLELKTRINREKGTNTEEYHTKLKIAAQKNKHYSSERLKERWKDPEKRSEMCKKLFSEETKKKRIAKFKKHIKENYEEYVAAMNRPERKEKLRNHAHQRMKNKEEKMVKWLNSCRSRQFEVNNIKMNRIEFLTATFLNSLNVKWEYEKLFVLNKKSYIPDFYLPEYNLIIECNGDYWHANPKLFKEKDEVKRTKLTAKQIWERDEERINNFKQNKYNVITLWEEEILNNKFKKKIKNGLN